MKTIAIFDVETDSTDAQTGHLLEVGCVLWSVKHRALINAASWLVDCGIQENAALAVNGIAPELLTRGLAPSTVRSFVHSAAAEADALTAWNADFDRQWLPEDIGKPWFDAMDDLEWPRSSSSRMLVEVALAHGVGVVDAHRALADCLTIARLLERTAEILDAHNGNEAGDPFPRWLARALRPKVHVEVSDSRFNADMNAVYKEHGFRWAPAPAKRWRRKMFAEDARKLPFVVQEVRP